MKKIAILILLTVLIGVPNLHAGFDYEVGFVTSYVWRGMDLLPKNKPAIQPSITYTFGDSGFSINAWASFSLTDRSELSSVDEIDFTFNYDFQISENVALSAGLINYGYYWDPGYTFKNSNSQELYVTLSLPKVILSPTFAVYYDFNLGEGLYASAGGGYSFKITDEINLDLGATLGYNGEQWIEESGISDLNINAAVPLTIGKCKITPTLNYTRVFLDSLYREGDKKDKFWLAVTVAIQ